MNKKIFLSYCHENTKEADKIDEEFMKKNIILTRDKRDLKYKQNIEEFMKKIREHDFAILLISHEYLTSSSCMYEFLEALKERDCKEKILPIILVYNFYDSNCRVRYNEYWIKEVKKIENELEQLSAKKMWSLLGSKSEELKKYKKIELEIDEIIKDLQNKGMINFFDEEKNNFKTIFKEIGIDDQKENKKNDITVMNEEKIESSFKNYIKKHSATDEDIEALFSESNNKEVSFKSSDIVEADKESNEDSSFENGKQGFLRGIVNDDVINYIEFLLKKSLLCDFIIKHGNDNIQNISNTILKLNNVLQEKVMKYIFNNHVEATGYGNWQNYDYFGSLAYEVYENISNSTTKKIAYNIIENCANYRYQFTNLLKELEKEKYI